MKVVLLHDWLTGFRGGERVLEAFCEMFPEAPIYTLIHVKGSVPRSIESHKIASSFLSKIPSIGSTYRKFLPLFPKAAESLKIIEDADVVLSSSHCVIKGVLKPKGSVHVSYIHSPMRYLYDQFDNYFGKDAPLLQRVGIRFFKDSLVRWDQESNKNVDVMIANSAFVQSRIHNFYDRESEVIHPFVDLKDFAHLKNEGPAKEDYFIMVTAFAPNKRVDLAIKACNQLKLNLKIIGGGQQEDFLKSIAGPTIEFLGNVSREEVTTSFAKARAMIFPGVEDFGITPLESLASGTPIIAYKKGGVLETLTDETADFFEQDSVDALSSALQAFKADRFDRKKLIERAQHFSKEQFQTKIMNTIELALKEHKK